MGKPTDMSRDRVHFSIQPCYLMRESIRNCLMETMGLPLSQLLAMSRADQDLHIICRPSQFARFIILRHVKYNEPNNMACLQMRLVLPPKPTEVTDVSHNPNSAGFTDAEGAMQVRRTN